MSREDFNKVLARLQAQCVKREYCASDMRQKALKAFDGDAEEAERAVSALVEDRFVDNLRYSSAFAREKSRLTGWGPVKIEYALLAKGIDRETVRAALQEVDADEAGRRMRAVLEAKCRTLKGDPQEKLKLLKFALSRGYEYSVAAPVVDEILSARKID